MESGGNPDVEESSFAGTAGSETESSSSGEGGSQTKAESQNGQESREAESKASEAATGSSAAKAEAGQKARVFFEGEGTEEAPYLIGTAKELEKLAELMASDYENYGDRSYRLTQNIQMKKGRNNHKAIGSTEHPFIGEFDGDGYVISRIRINRPRLEEQGLFGVVGEEGTVRNVGLTENIICGGDQVGAIAGINFGTVESCFQTGEVYGVNNNVGSLVGQNRGSVADCYSTGLVCGGYRVGDYIPETEGEEKGRKAGRGGFRDFIQTIAETIAETVAETVAYVIEETRAGLETLYEMVTTTLSAEGGPGVSGDGGARLWSSGDRGKRPWSSEERRKGIRYPGAGERRFWGGRKRCRRKYDVWGSWNRLGKAGKDGRTGDNGRTGNDGSAGNDERTGADRGGPGEIPRCGHRISRERGDSSEKWCNRAVNGE